MEFKFKDLNWGDKRKVADLIEQIADLKGKNREIQQVQTISKHEFARKVQKLEEKHRSLSQQKSQIAAELHKSQQILSKMQRNSEKSAKKPLSALYEVKSLREDMGVLMQTLKKRSVQSLSSTRPCSHPPVTYDHSLFTLIDSLPPPSTYSI